MSVSKRDSIIENIKTELSKIKTANGYNYNVGLIQERVLDPDGITDDAKFPALIVVDSEELKTDGDLDELQNSLSVIILGYVKRADDTTDLKANIRKLLADVEKCLCVDRYRGGLAHNTIPAAIKTDHGFNDPYGLFEFTFKISYLQTYGTP